MKNANNNEIDLVLRSLAKGGRDDSTVGMDTALGENNGESGEHLDANELNFFAEGLVPELGRARYTKHLADCPSCRGLVVSLSQAAGTVAPVPLAERQSGPGFWQRMMVFLSLPVMKYAVPALALTGVIAVSFFALRQQEQADQFVAKQEASSQAPSAAERQTTEPLVGASGNDAPRRLEKHADSRASTESRTRGNNVPGEESEIAKAPAKTDLAAGVLKDSAAPPPPVPASKAGGSQPPFAPEPKLGATSVVRPVTSEADKKIEARKDRESAEQTQQGARDQYNVEASKQAEDNRSGFMIENRSGPRRSDGAMAERPVYRAKNKRGTDEDETRSVSGRRFRRQGNAWVDTSYESSRATINVTRGSEQFRALVADEPGIRSVADQLGGEVIVVWKGKAYRIR